MYVLIAIVVSDFVLPWFVTGDLAWYAHDVSGHVQVGALCLMLSQHLPRTQLALFCGIVFYGMSELVQATMELVWYLWDVYYFSLDLVRCLTVIAGVVYYRFRRYDIPSDKFDPHKTFITYRKPLTYQDKLLALIGVPAGGVGVWADGHWYRYKRGRLVRLSMSTGINNHVTILLNNDGKRIAARLNERVGIKWTITQNCLTVIRLVIIQECRPWSTRR